MRAISKLMTAAYSLLIRRPGTVMRNEPDCENQHTGDYKEYLAAGNKAGKGQRANDKNGSYERLH